MWTSIFYQLNKKTNYGLQREEGGGGGEESGSRNSVKGKTKNKMMPVRYRKYSGAISVEKVDTFLLFLILVENL